MTKSKKKRYNYTQFTLKALHDLGYHAAPVERWIAQAWRKDGRGIRQDFMGFIDIIAFAPGCGVVGVQSTGPNGYYSHNKKILQECNEVARDWLESPAKLELWCWYKKEKRKGLKQKIWKPEIKEYQVQDFSVLEPKTTTKDVEIIKL